MSFASGPIRISTESLVQLVGLSDLPELEEGNARAVGIAVSYSSIRRVLNDCAHQYAS